MVLFANIIQGTLSNEEQLALLDKYTVVLSLGTDGRYIKYMLMSNPYNHTDNEIASFCNDLSNCFGYERSGDLFIVYGD